MDNPNQEEDFLSDFKQFLSFLKNLWGLLAGVSVFFPLSNVFFKLIPISSTQDDPSGGWSYVTTGLITGLTMLVLFFILLWTYGQRLQFKDSEYRTGVPRLAWSWFVIGIICLLGYIGMHQTILMGIYTRLEITHGDSGRFLGDILLFVLYSGFFASMLRAFVLLAMNEYFKTYE